jgi:hypothetical protein
MDASKDCGKSKILVGFSGRSSRRNKRHVHKKSRRYGKQITQNAETEYFQSNEERLSD